MTIEDKTRRLGLFIASSLDATDVQLRIEPGPAGIAIFVESTKDRGQKCELVRIPASSEGVVTDSALRRIHISPKK